MEVSPAEFFMAKTNIGKRIPASALLRGVVGRPPPASCSAFAWLSALISANSLTYALHSDGMEPE